MRCWDAFGESSGECDRLSASWLSAQEGRTRVASTPIIALHREYRVGEVLHYEMKGSNHGWEYQIEATDVTRKDATDGFYEEIGWSNLRSNAPMTLSPTSLAFRQTFSTESGKYLAVPDLSKVQPFLIGPITDMLKFYSDIWIAKEKKLTQVGQHVYFEHGKPNSWADGQHVVLVRTRSIST